MASAGENRPGPAGAAATVRGLRPIGSEILQPPPAPAGGSTQQSRRGWSAGAAPLRWCGQPAEGPAADLPGEIKPAPGPATGPVIQPEQGNASCRHAGETRLEDNQWQSMWCQWQRWLTDLEAERFVFASPAQPWPRPRPTAAGNGGAGCWGECSAGRLLRAPAGPAGGRWTRGLQHGTTACCARARSSASDAASRRLADQVEKHQCPPAAGPMPLLCGLSPSAGRIREAQSLLQTRPAAAAPRWPRSRQRLNSTKPHPPSRSTAALTFPRATPADQADEPSGACEQASRRC